MIPVTHALGSCANIKNRPVYGSVVWPNDYDVCPDVLRFWCEVGHAASPAETDAHFAAIEQMVA
ncbi:MAG: hypothetical protein HY674_05750 [Chloroflexi bacterium]|nr:hypothetical protein [Chloroflexota bacterium]